MLSDYYREPNRSGDYFVVHRHNGEIEPGKWPGRASSVPTRPESVRDTILPSAFISPSWPVKRQDIPAEWRLALDGTESGLSDAAIQEAAQDLYAVVFADAWEEAGGRFAPGSCINDVVPPVPETGVEVVRSWIRDMDARLPYPLFDLFMALGIDDDDEGHGSALYDLCMGAIGHGVNLFDYVDDHCDPDAWSQAAETMGVNALDHRSSIHLDDWRLREVAEDWISTHQPDPSNPTEIPSAIRS